MRFRRSGRDGEGHSKCGPRVGHSHASNIAHILPSGVLALARNNRHSLLFSIPSPIQEGAEHDCP
jgi:hypothetical protein